MCFCISFQVLRCYKCVRLVGSFIVICSFFYSFVSLLVSHREKLVESYCFTCTPTMKTSNTNNATDNDEDDDSVGTRAWKIVCRTKRAHIFSRYVFRLRWRQVRKKYGTVVIRSLFFFPQFSLLHSFDSLAVYVVYTQSVLGVWCGFR